MASSDVLPVSPRHHSGGSSGVIAQAFKVRAKYNNTPTPTATHCRAVVRMLNPKNPEPETTVLRRIPMFGQKLKHRLSEPSLLPELKSVKEHAGENNVTLIPSSGPSSSDLIHQTKISATPLTRGPYKPGEQPLVTPSVVLTPASSVNPTTHVPDDVAPVREPLEKLVRTLQQRCKDQQAEIFALRTKSTEVANEMRNWKLKRGSELLHLSAQLYWLESNLRKDQQRLKWKVESRDRTIHMQHRTIHQLTQQLKDKNSRYCSCWKTSLSTGAGAQSSSGGYSFSSDSETVGSKPGSGSSTEKGTTDDDSAVVMDEDCADCSSTSMPSSSSTGGYRGATSIVRSVSDALECACIQNSDSRRQHLQHQLQQYSTAPTPTPTTNTVRRGSLKHNLDHPFNGYLRKPEVLETVYSVDEETDETEQQQVQSTPDSTGQKTTSSFGLLARSESCEFSNILVPGNTGRQLSSSSSTAVSLMNRLRPKRYFGSCDNVALTMKSSSAASSSDYYSLNSRACSYKPKSMENLMNLSSDVPVGDCFLYRYQLIEGISPPTHRKHLAVGDVSVSLRASPEPPKVHQAPVPRIQVTAASGGGKTNHKAFQKPKDVKAKRSNANGSSNGAGAKPSRSKSVEELRCRLWDWMGLRRHRQS